MEQQGFELLSEREIQILHAATDGLTDQQIGNQIGISASTVNSYWVRIRGKLGHYSRTELVSRYLRKQALDEVDALKNRIAELEEQVLHAGQAALEAEHPDAFRIAFDLAPEAMFICDDQGLIIDANERLAQMFEYEAHRLRGTNFRRLFRTGFRVDSRFLTLDLSADPSQYRFGSPEVLYGSKGAGRGTFRAILCIGRASNKYPGIRCCVVRSFSDELQETLSRASSIASQFG